MHDTRESETITSFMFGMLNLCLMCFYLCYFLYLYCNCDILKTTWRQEIMLILVAGTVNNCSW